MGWRDHEDVRRAVTELRRGRRRDLQAPDSRTRRHVKTVGWSLVAVAGAAALTIALTTRSEPWPPPGSLAVDTEPDRDYGPGVGGVSLTGVLQFKGLKDGKACYWIDDAFVQWPYHFRADARTHALLDEHGHVVARPGDMLAVIGSAGSNVTDACATGAPRHFTGGIDAAMRNPTPPPP